MDVQWYILVAKIWRFRN